MPEPFVIEVIDPDRTIVRVAPICSHPRTRDAEADLEAAVDSTAGTVAVDLSKTEVLTSEWFRFLNALTIRAAGSGKRLVVVGMSNTLKKTADALALSRKLAQAPTIDEAWKP